MRHLILLALTLSLATLSVGCQRKPEPPGPTSTEANPPPPTNRVDISPAVRQNLGITFAKVERRHVARTLRLPGRFELAPTARREYRVPAAGSVELLVHQYEPVEAGTPLYRLDSPRWRELQGELTDAEAAVSLARAEAESIGPLIEAHEQHHAAIEHAIDLWAQRVGALEQLQAAGGARGEDIAQARASLASARSDLAEVAETHVQLDTREREARARLEAAEARKLILIEAAASLHSLPMAELQRPGKEGPRWREMGHVEVRARTAGVVDAIHVSTGTYVDQHAPVLATVQPQQVRFRAHALQSDLGRLGGGLPATVVAPQGGTLGGAEPVPGTLTLAPTADAERRTIELVLTPDDATGIAPWALAGVSGFLEVVVEGSGGTELAVPLASIARDGAQSIFFRRDPRNPDAAIRMEADIGLDDGRWIVIKSGVAEGNEVVLDGVYQLMIATSGSITPGGHFHPDGTFHEGDH